MAPHGSVAVVPLITTRSSGGVTMDVRSEKTQVATQTKPRACASLPRGSGLPAWRRKLPDSSSLGKTHVNGSTQRRRGGGESSRRSQKPSLGPLGSPAGPQTLRKRREGSVPRTRTRPSRSAGSEPRLPPRTRAVQLPPALRPSARHHAAAASSRSSYSSRRPRGGRGVSTPCFREPTLRLRNATAGRAPPGW